MNPDHDTAQWHALLREAIEAALDELCVLQRELEAAGGALRHLQMRGHLVLKFIYTARNLLSPVEMTEADLEWGRHEARRLGLKDV
jgi:hypothetical protein